MFINDKDLCDRSCSPFLSMKGNQKVKKTRQFSPPDSFHPCTSNITFMYFNGRFSGPQTIKLKEVNKNLHQQKLPVLLCLRILSHLLYVKLIFPSHKNKNVSRCVTKMYKTIYWKCQKHLSLCNLFVKLGGGKMLIVYLTGRKQVSQTHSGVYQIPNKDSH